MGMIFITCHGCGFDNEVDIEDTNKVVRCVKCNTNILEGRK